MGAGTAAADDYSKEDEYLLWCKYEDVAMHFNDLIMRLRTQALGGLTGVVAISGFAMNFTSKPSSATEWSILCGTFLFFALAWLALWVLDLGYYNKLLEGAVEAIIAHERRTPPLPCGNARINLSSIIRDHSPNYKRVVRLFYIIVFAGLAAATGYAGFNAMWPPKPHQDSLEYKLERTSADKLQLTVEPTSASATPSPRNNNAFAPSTSAAIGADKK